MSKIFLDVGAHLGETAQVALEKQYAFDRICCFEPSTKCRSQLEALAQADPRVELYPFGLGAADCRKWLRKSGEVGATVMGNDSLPETPDSEFVAFRDVAAWMDQNLEAEDFCVMKVNCEGSEVEILERLLEAKKLNYFYSVVISWDIREQQEGTALEAALRRKIRESGALNCCSSDDVLLGETHAARLRYWMKLFGIHRSDCDQDQLRKEYKNVFIKYSRKTGALHRFEHSLKHFMRYEIFPDWIKRLLRFSKRSVRLNRDRKVDKL